MTPEGPTLLRAINAENDPLVASLAKISLYTDRFSETPRQTAARAAISTSVSSRKLRMKNCKLSPLAKTRTSFLRKDNATFNKLDLTMSGTSLGFTKSSFNYDTSPTNINQVKRVNVQERFLSGINVIEPMKPIQPKKVMQRSLTDMNENIQMLGKLKSLKIREVSPVREPMMIYHKRHWNLRKKLIQRRSLSSFQSWHNDDAMQNSSLSSSLSIDPVVEDVSIDFPF